MKVIEYAELFNRIPGIAVSGVFTAIALLAVGSTYSRKPDAAALVLAGFSLGMAVGAITLILSLENRMP